MLTLVSDIGGAAGLIAGVSMALVCGVLGDSHSSIYAHALVCSPIISSELYMYLTNHFRFGCYAYLSESLCLLQWSLLEC